MAVNRFLADEELDIPEETKQVLDGARARMDRWIDDSVDKLVKDMGEVISQAAGELRAEVDKVAEELADSRQRIEALAAKLGQADLQTGAGDGITLDEALRETRQQVELVRAELAAREQRWRGMGETIVNTGVSAAGRILGVPLP